MTAMQRILCPIDFSEGSTAALRFATALARWYRAEITVMHVAPVLPRWELAAHREESPSAEALRRQLDELLTPAREAGVSTAILVCDGAAGPQILRRADEGAADLIVMGTHGRSGFRRLALGSVSEAVLRKSACPVLTVRERMAPPAGSQAPFRSLLCPVDFSPASARAVAAGLDLGAQSAAEVSLLHVVEPIVDREIQKRTHFDSAEYWRRVEEDSVMRMDALVLPLVRRTCYVRLLMRIGRPGEEICRVAAAHRADAIVMGVHGRSAARLAVFGSVAQDVVRHAPCPVLTLAGHDDGRRPSKQAAQLTSA